MVVESGCGTVAQTDASGLTHSIFNNKTRNPPDKRHLTMVLDCAATARISVSLQKAEHTLQYYHNWTEFDDQIRNVYVVVQKLASTLRVLKIALEQDLDRSDPNNTLDSLWSSKRVTAPLLEQLTLLKFDQTRNYSKRPSLIPQAFEDRDALILSFRKRMRKRLYSSVSDIQNIAMSLVRDLDLYTPHASSSSFN
jgi:hypothetical protein